MMNEEVIAENRPAYHRENEVEENEGYEIQNRTHEKEGSVQISDVFRYKVIVMLVSDFLVDGPKVCCWIVLELWRFPICDRLLQPKTRRRYLDGIGSL